MLTRTTHTGEIMKTKVRHLAGKIMPGTHAGDGHHRTLPGDMDTNQRRIVNLWHPERVRLSPQRRIK